MNEDLKPDLIWRLEGNERGKVIASRGLGFKRSDGGHFYVICDSSGYPLFSHVDRQIAFECLKAFLRLPIDWERQTHQSISNQQRRLVAGVNRYYAFREAS